MLQYKDTNPIAALSARSLLLHTAIQLSLLNPTDPIPNQEFKLPASHRRASENNNDHDGAKTDLVLTISQYNGRIGGGGSNQPFEARFAQWAIFNMLIGLSKREREGKGFVEAGEIVFWEGRERGVLFLEGAAEGSVGEGAVGGVTQGGEVTVVTRRDEGNATGFDALSASAPLGNLTTTVLDLDQGTRDADDHASLQGGQNFTLSADEPEIVVRTRPISMDPFSQSDMYVAALNAVVGLIEIPELPQDEIYRSPNSFARTEVLVEGPRPLRREPPFNNKAITARVIGRMVGTCAASDYWREIKGLAFVQDIWISTTTIRKWQPPS